MRFYRFGELSALGRALAAAMVVAYALWATGSGDGLAHAWHLVSVLPLAAALVRFDWLAGQGTGRPVEDLLARDRPMAVAELAWLALFALGLSS
jgi:decaprenyl-phosphate phosphoribosyltransferase